MSPTEPLCSNFKRHSDAGARWQEGTALYKREQRAAEFRRGFESDQRNCDYCWPPCPTCGHREPRKR